MRHLAPEDPRLLCELAGIWRARGLAEVCGGEGFDVARCMAARLMKAIGSIPPAGAEAEAEADYYAALETEAKAA
jgi:hypothetical protein